MKIVNVNREVVLASRAELARSPLRRTIGLLDRARLAEGEGLIIVPCQAVHTFFMRFPIDVAFTDGTGKVLAVYHQLSPYRFTRIIRGARGAVELPAGTLEKSGTEPGHTLAFYEEKFRLPGL